MSVSDREYARHDCPHCGVVLDLLPKAKKRCPSCGRGIFVKSGPDNRRYLLREDERAATEERWARQAPERHTTAWAAYQRATAEAVQAAGIQSGEGYLEVVGESYRLSALVTLVARYPGRRAVAALEREPSNPHDRNAIRVLIDGDDGAADLACD